MEIDAGGFSSLDGGRDQAVGQLEVAGAMLVELGQLLPGARIEATRVSQARLPEGTGCRPPRLPLLVESKSKQEALTGGAPEP
jgi:hypothetical protein